MAALIIVLAAFILATWFVFRRRQLASQQLTAAFSQFIHPRTLEALTGNGKNEELKEDGLWVRAHERELIGKYGSRWIAVISRDVVAVAESGDAAWEETNRKFPGRTAFIRRLSKEHLDFETEWNKRSN